MLESLNPFLSNTKAAGLGATAGATGSLMGQLLGVLDQPRQLAWSMIPGLHDDGGNALSGDQVASNLFGVDPESLGARIGGIGINTALDPLTWIGPLAGMAGNRAATAVGRVGAANRAGVAAADVAPALRSAADEAAAAAQAMPDFSKIVGIGGREYPTDVVKGALSTGNLSALRKYGGAGGLGTVINRPTSDFLVDQLERQGFGSSILNPDGSLSTKFLLSSDPETRALFAPRGGRLQQLAEVSPDASGPLAPLFRSAPEPQTIGAVLGPERLEDLARRSPILDALLNDAGCAV